ncbi:MAG: hypothetical protein ACK4NC_05935 [Candidatus Gracilibacteria bacterium]
MSERILPETLIKDKFETIKQLYETKQSELNKLEQEYFKLKHALEMFEQFGIDEEQHRKNRNIDKWPFIVRALERLGQSSSYREIFTEMKNIGWKDDLNEKALYAYLKRKSDNRDELIFTGEGEFRLPNQKITDREQEEEISIEDVPF